MGAKVRRLENNLLTLGAGIIAFSGWTFVKFALNSLLFGESLKESLGDDYTLAVAIIVWVFSALAFLLYLWLGLSARAEGRGKHKSVFYLIVIGLLSLFGAISVLLDALSLVFLTSGIGEIVIATIIDVTRLVFMIELMVSSAKLRKLRKTAAVGERSAA